MRKAARRWTVRTAFIAFLVAAVSAITATTVFAGPSAQPSGITNEADDLHNLYLLVLSIALVVFFAVEGALIFAIIRYRKRNDDLPPQVHGNNLLEIIWTTIPVVIVLVLFVFSFITLVDVEHDAKPNDLTVHVQGFQFQWQFTYCKNDLGNGGSDAPKKDPNAEYQGPCQSQDDEVVVLGTAAEEPTLTIPIDEPIEFQLSSNDVIHSFFIRDFLYKLDVVPGRDNRFVVTPNTLGSYDGQCAELCGLNHALMRFHVHVVSRADFDKFIADASAANQAAARP